MRRLGVIVRHVLPNSSGPVLVLAALEFGTAILAVSALSFLGFGAAKPAPEWGVAGRRGTQLPGDVLVADHPARAGGGGRGAGGQSGQPGRRRTAAAVMSGPLPSAPSTDPASEDATGAARRRPPGRVPGPPRGGASGAGRLLRDPPRRGGRDRRRVRLRKDHDRAGGHRVAGRRRTDHGRPDPARRGSHRPAAGAGDEPDPRWPHRARPAGSGGVAQSGPAGRRPGRRGLAHPRTGRPAICRRQGIGGARRGRARRAGDQGRAVPAPAVRWYAAAGADRHSVGLQPGSAHRRRADLCPGRHGAAHRSWTTCRR